MNRDKLLSQVKEEYTNLASGKAQQHFHQTTTGVTPEGYYENLLAMVTNEINAGTFDTFKSGKQIVESVAADKHKWLPEWGQNE